MLSFKHGVEFQPTPELWAIFVALDAAYASQGRTCRVTAVRDGKHKVGSLHYKNRAVDAGTRELTGKERVAVQLALQRLLGPDYDVVFETDLFDAAGTQTRWQHLHVEHDPKPKKEGV
jgi:hypothetical protein